MSFGGSEDVDLSLFNARVEMFCCKRRCNEWSGVLAQPMMTTSLSGWLALADGAALLHAGRRRQSRQEVGAQASLGRAATTATRDEGAKAEAAATMAACFPTLSRKKGSGASILEGEEDDGSGGIMEQTKKELRTGRPKQASDSLSQPSRDQVCGLYCCLCVCLEWSSKAEQAQSSIRAAHSAAGGWR